MKVKSKILMSVMLAAMLVVQVCFAQKFDEERMQRDIAVAENVLTQLENLRTYPVIHSRMHQGKLNLYGWIYQIENAEVLTYNPNSDEFEPILHDLPACDLPNTAPSNGLEQTVQHQIQQIELDRKYSEGWLSPGQAERIYRGSHAR
ncbi:MAG: hypothetical protein HC770_11310 [Pseudanabaena sp. CRU_2_10]|nr:hypothetical protein [Pseudanabaena sp. CRU_2_10]